MKHLPLTLLLLISLSCNQEKKEPDPISEDSTILATPVTDNLMDKIKNDLFDTAGISKAPVKILSAKLVKKEYSNYKDIALSYQNVSGKTVNAIRFKWYGEDAFNEPADMGTVEGFGSGFTDDPLKPGKMDHGTFNISSRDGKKVILAWPTEVVFEDGTKWKAGN